MADAPKILGTDTLRDAYPKLNSAIDNSNEAKTKADGADVKADTAIETANTAKTTADTVQSQFDQVVAEAGENNPEVVQARGEAVNLNARLNATDAQLADTWQQKTNQLFAQDMVIHREIKPTFTIIDDDGRPQVFDILKPLAEEYQIPITSAIITGRVGDSELHMSLAQLKQLEKSGFEFVSHTVNHLDLATITLEEADYELRESKKWMIENGFNGDTAIVYPFGGTTSSVDKLSRKYYRSAITAGGVTPYPNYPSDFTTYRVKRVAFEESVETIKSAIDEAVQNNGWLILMNHVHFPDWTEAKFREIVEYAQSSGIEFANAKDGLNRFGNILDIESDSSSSLGATVINALGEVTSGKIGATRIISNSSIPNLSNSTPITSFKQPCVSLTNITGALSSGFPENSAGVLLTYRMANDLYSFQIYHLLGNNKIYKRRWENGTWTVWANTDENSVVYHSTDSFNNGSTFNAFDTKKINIVKITSGNITGFPENSPGTLIVTSANGDGYSFRTYYLYQSNKAYRSWWDGSSWTSWRRVTEELFDKKATLNFGTINANSSKEMAVSTSLATPYAAITPTPIGGIEQGVSWNAYIANSGTITLRINNLTTSNITLSSREWMFRITQE
jgi:peptidoglycan/xylan/chitin deacetylase (PgdA/CDA1 family)